MLSLDLRLGSGCLNIIKQKFEKGRSNKYAKHPGHMLKSQESPKIKRFSKPQISLKYSFDYF